MAFWTTREDLNELPQLMRCSYVIKFLGRHIHTDALFCSQHAMEKIFNPFDLFVYVCSSYTKVGLARSELVG
jgi:hypothetical protein